MELLRFQNHGSLGMVGRKSAIAITLVFVVFLTSCGKEDEKIVRVAEQQLTLGMIEEASQSYQRVLAINPGNAKAHLGMAIIYYREGQVRESLESIYRISILGKLKEFKKPLLENFGWIFYTVPILTLPEKFSYELIFSPDHRYVAFTTDGELHVLDCNSRLQEITSEIDSLPRLESVKWIDNQTLLVPRKSRDFFNFRWYVVKITNGITKDSQFLWETADIKISPDRDFIVGKHINSQSFSKLTAFPYEDSVFLVARLEKEEKVFVKMGSIFKVKGCWISFDWLDSRTLRISYYLSDTNGDGKIDFADEREDLYFDVPLMKKLQDYSNEPKPKGKRSPDGKYSLLVRKKRLILRNSQGEEKELGLEGNIRICSWVNSSQAIVERQIQGENQPGEFFLVNISGDIHPFPRDPLPRNSVVGALDVRPPWILLSIVKKLSPQEREKLDSLSSLVKFLKEIWLVDNKGRRKALITPDSLPLSDFPPFSDFWVVDDQFLLLNQTSLQEIETKSMILDLKSKHLFVLPFELEMVVDNLLFFRLEKYGPGIFVVELKEDFSGGRINEWRKFCPKLTELLASWQD